MDLVAEPSVDLVLLTAYRFSGSLNQLSNNSSRSAIMTIGVALMNEKI